MTLDLQGKKVTVAIPEALYLNTDSGYPDAIEFSGPDTYLSAVPPDKLHDGPDGLSDYQPLVGAGIPVKTQDSEKPLLLNIPEVGKYTVLAGTLTLRSFQHGMNGRDLWEGDVQLTLQTSAGPTPVSGPFRITIVPVW